MHASQNTFEAPPRTARVPDLPPPPADTATRASVDRSPPITGRRLLTPDLEPHSSPLGVPGPPSDGPRLAPSPQPARPNVMTLPPAQLLSPTPGPGGSPGVAPRPAPSSVAANLFAPPTDMATKVAERRHRARFRKLVTMLVILTMTAGGFAAWTKLRPQDPAGPDAWDARVVSLVSFVEQTRGMKFEHPVAIEFLDPDEYRARLRADAVDVTDEERADAEYQEALNDVFGLTATYQLLETLGEIDARSSLGFYSSETDTIVVRGQGLTPGVRATVVHELTHALQAQNLDVGGRFGDRSTRSMVEADAMAVESVYEGTMTPEDQWNAAVESQPSKDDKAALDALPWTLVELEYAPYRLGSLALERRGGGSNQSTNQAVTEPPTEHQMIAPWAADDPDLSDLKVAAPEGAAVVEADRPLSLLETLVSFDAWLPWAMARPAFDPWVGGVYTTYRTTEDGPLCAAVRVRLSAAPEVFANVVTWWSSAMGGPATPTVDGNDVLFALCARGEGAPEPPKPVVPTSVAVELEVSMVPAEAIPPPGQIMIADPTKPTITQYLCVARTVVDDPKLGPLITEAFPTPEQQATIDRGIDAAVQHCLG